MSSLECRNSVFILTNGNNSFLITLLGHWQTKSDGKTIDELNNLLELRSLDIHVKEVRKRGNKIKIGDKEFTLSDFDTQKMRYLKNYKM